MRTGNPIDGMYFLTLVIPFVISLWFGDFIRKKIIFHFEMQSSLVHSFSSFIGIIAEIIIIMAGILSGLMLIKVI